MWRGLRPAQLPEAPSLLAGGCLGSKMWRLDLSRAGANPLTSQTSCSQPWLPTGVASGTFVDVNHSLGQLDSKRDCQSRDLTLINSSYQTMKKQEPHCPKRPSAPPGPSPPGGADAPSLRRIDALRSMCSFPIMLWLVFSFNPSGATCLKTRRLGRAGELCEES